MDILIGGIPRSGTTALARALGLHPDVFCWFSETDLLPLVATLTSGLKLLPANLLVIENEIHRHLTSTLVAMAEWNSAKSRTPVGPVLSDSAITGLTRGICSILARQLDKATTLRECSELLRGFLASLTDRPRIAEKTPANALLCAEHVALAKMWLFMRREPFAALASMRARVGRDPWASVFAGPIERQIGLYNAYSRALVSASKLASSVRIIDYQALMGKIESILPEVCVLLGLDASAEFIRNVESIVGGNIATNQWSECAPFDRWKVIRLCAPAMQAFGYDEQFYGVAFGDLTSPLPDKLESHLEAIYGVYPPDERSGNSWMERYASLALYAPNDCTSVTLRLYNSLDRFTSVAAELGIAGREWSVRTACRTSSGETMPLGAFPVAPGEPTEWKLDLRSVEPLAQHGNWKLIELTLESDFAYVPIFSMPDGSDARNLSMLLRGWRMD